MANVVGSKGQVVITKEIREQLGVKPGWLALQRVVDDHVEIHFVRPKHKESLRGSLAPFIKARIGSGPEWDKARQTAWERAAREKAGPEETGA